MKKIAILFLVEIVLCFSMSGCYEKQDIIDARDEGYQLAEEKYTEELETLKSDANSYERRIYELEKELEEQYRLGHSDGYDEGYDEGYEEGKQSGYDSGYDEGYRVGYQDGYSEAESACEDKHGSYTSYSQTSSYQPPASQNTEPVQTSVTVYITKTGTKYHTSTCSYLKNSKISISKDSAIAQGYTACSRCKP